MSRVILLVESAVSVRDVLTRVFEKIGYVAHSFADSGSAFEFLRKAGANLDLVITDLQQPGWLSGLDRIREFHQINPRAPVLIITGQGFEGDDAIPVLKKPFGLDELKTKVELLLKESM